MARVREQAGDVAFSSWWRGGRSIDWYLGLLVISTLAPALAFSAYLLWNFINFERRSYEQQLLQSAIDLANDIDRDIEGLIVKLSTLATLPSLHRRDVAEFYAQGAEAAVHDSNIVVLDLSLQQIANTLVLYGTALPKTGDPETAVRAIARKSPQVSDLFTGAVADHVAKFAAPCFSKQVLHGYQRCGNNGGFRIRCFRWQLQMSARHHEPKNRC